MLTEWGLKTETGFHTVCHHMPLSFSDITNHAYDYLQLWDPIMSDCVWKKTYKNPTKYTVFAERDDRCEAADVEAFQIVFYAAGNYFCTHSSHIDCRRNADKIHHIVKINTKYDKIGYILLPSTLLESTVLFRCTVDFILLVATSSLLAATNQGPPF